MLLWKHVYTQDTPTKGYQRHNSTCLYRHCEYWCPKYATIVEVEKGQINFFSTVLHTLSLSYRCGVSRLMPPVSTRGKNCFLCSAFRGVARLLKNEGRQGVAQGWGSWLGLKKAALHIDPCTKWHCHFMGAGLLRRQVPSLPAPIWLCPCYRTGL